MYAIRSYYAHIVLVNMAVCGGANTRHWTSYDSLSAADIAVFVFLARRAAELVVADQLAPGKQGFFFQSVNIFQANQLVPKEKLIVVVKTVFGYAGKFYHALRGLV